MNPGRLRPDTEWRSPLLKANSRHLSHSSFGAFRARGASAPPCRLPLIDYEVTEDRGQHPSDCGRCVPIRWVTADGASA